MKHKVMQKQKTSESAKISTGFSSTTDQTQGLIQLKDTSTDPMCCNPEVLNRLISSCGKYASWLRVLAANDGLLTHQLPDFGLKSNNAHNMSQYVNPRIIPLGFVVAKVVHTVPSKSWSWHLWTVSHALKMPINKALMATIQDCLEAANDSEY